MAEVFLARDQLLDRAVAVKVLFPEFASDPKFVERFRREAQSAANLNHPNIVGVHDWGQERGTYFIVMEYVEGRSLAQIIHEDGPLPEDRSISIASDIAAGLAVAHRNGVVHRDIKPGNVLITAAGEVKVTDFGIARATNAQPQDGLTQTGAVMGTASYLSPEQAQGHQADPRSDIYSLSIVLYEMLTTRPPFSGDTPVAIAYKHVQEPPTPPRQLNPNISPNLEAVIMRGLAKDPQQRYGNAEAFRADLQEVRTGGIPFAVSQRESGAPVAEVAAVAAAAAVASSVDPIAPPLAPPTTMMAPQYANGYDDEPPRRTGLFIAVMALLFAVLALLIYFFAQSLSSDDGAPTSTTSEAELEVEVPDVVGEQVEDAERALRNEGFDVRVTREQDETFPPGQILRQNPRAGETVPGGSEIEIVAAQAPDEIPMINVVGQTEDDAKANLRELGFIPLTVRAVDESVPEGVVISQQPPVGTTLSQGSTVEITVSTGRERVIVPDLTGATLQEARVELADLALNSTETQEPSDEVEQGLVIRTTPVAGTTVDSGSSVDIVVSSGKELVPIPILKTKPEAQAIAELTALGFVAQVVDKAVLEDDPNVGLVIDVSPPEGTSVEKGTTVTITVARGTIPTTTTTAPPVVTTTIAPPVVTTTIAP
jgi:eukaryotic-like serine/threonine-protein kinase